MCGAAQLNGNTANYTINLTGIILLGLAMSSAVTLWSYLHLLFERKSIQSLVSHVLPEPAGDYAAPLDNNIYKVPPLVDSPNPPDSVD